ncbi:MAG TPA: hypothetical protein VK588_00855 [Chitinophagaceae bacterium]|nr:hypothetical protein [Chitinophagaceae bacterium]
MLSGQIIIYSLAGLFLFLPIQFFVGKIIGTRRFVFTRPESFSEIFYYSWIGFFTIISVFAIIITAGRTILLPVPFLIFLITLKIDFKGKDSNSFYSRNLYFVLLVALIYWAYSLLHFVSFNHNEIRFVGGDYLFYSNVSEYLNVTGKETYAVNYISPEFEGMRPYHYLDLWGAAFFSRLLTIRAVYSFYLVLFPLLACNIVLGLLSFFEKKYGKQSIFGFILILLFGFYSGYSVFFPSRLLSAEIIDYSIVYRAKLFICAFFLLILLNLFQDRQWRPFLFFSAIIALGFINFLPTVYLFSFLLVIFLLAGKRATIKEILPGVVAMGGVILVMYFMYRHAPPGEGSGTTMGSLPADYFKKMMHIFFGGLLQFVLLLPVFVLFVWVLYLKKIRTIREFLEHESGVFFFLSMTFFGLISWAILYPATAEAVQFYSNVFSAATPFLLLLIVYELVTFLKKNSYKIFAISIFFVSMIMDGHNKLPVETVSKLTFNNIIDFTGAYKGYYGNIKDRRSDKTFFDKNTIAYQPLPFLAYHFKPYLNTSLDAPWITIDSSFSYIADQKRNIEIAPFTQYVNRNPAQTSRDDMIISFLKKYNIQFVTVSSSLGVPAFLQKYINRKLVLPELQLTIFNLRF